MRSLTLKLTLGFVIVSLVGMALAAILTQHLTRAEFDRFLFQQGTTDLVSTLADHYAAAGSWQGCEQVISDFGAERIATLSALQPAASTPEAGGPNGGGRPRPFTPFILADASGRIVCGPPDRLGKVADRGNLRRGLLVEVEGQTVGYLLAGDNWNANRPLSPELAFLQQVNRIIGLSALASIGIAVFLGGLLARQLTRPLRELTAATQEIARGKLGEQVPVRSHDELGKLATAFNRMSTDLDKSTRLRKQMTADIAHDLRTPLSLILGYTEALSDGKLPGDPEIYTVMHQEAQHLNRLIDDLRLLSLADAGELPLNRTPLSAIVLLERAASAFRPQATAKGIDLRVDITEGLPSVMVDPERMAQVLGNLLANALRHTLNGGKIVLSASGQGNAVVLKVQDNGAGIAPADLPHVFDRFYRADKSRSDSGESGLGLTIARSLVEAHGGQISVESQPSQGATFIIRLPVDRNSQ